MWYENVSWGLSFGDVFPGEDNARRLVKYTWCDHNIVQKHVQADLHGQQNTVIDHPADSKQEHRTFWCILGYRNYTIGRILNVIMSSTGSQYSVFCLLLKMWKYFRRLARDGQFRTDWSCHIWNFGRPAWTALQKSRRMRVKEWSRP